MENSYYSQDGNDNFYSYTSFDWFNNDSNSWLEQSYNSSFDSVDFESYFDNLDEKYQEDYSYLESYNGYSWDNWGSWDNYGSTENRFGLGVFSSGINYDNYNWFNQYDNSQQNDFTSDFESIFEQDYASSLALES